MELRYCNIINNNEADLYLFGNVGENNRIDGDVIANEIRYLDEQGVKIIRQHINSGGGSIINGLSVISANFNAKAEIHTYNEGLAGSMGAIILLSGDKIFMADYAQIMLHNPSIGGQSLEDMPEGKDKTALNAMRDTLISILKRRCSFSDEKIKDILKNETWYNFNQAKRLGLIDDIIEYKKQPQFNDVTCLEDIMNEINNSKSKNNLKMENLKKINSALNLKEDSAEKDVLDAISNIKSEVEKIKGLEDEKTNLLSNVESLKEEKIGLEGEKTELENQISEKETELENKDKEIKDLNEKLVDQSIAKAIESGLFKESKKEELKNRFENNLEALDFFIAEADVKEKKILGQINNDNNDDENPRANWGARDYEKQDPKGLEKIKNEDPKKYQSLWDKSYGKNN